LWNFTCFHDNIATAGHLADVSMITLPQPVT